MRPRVMPQEVVLYEARVGPVPTHGALTHMEGRAVPYAVWTNRGLFMESVAAGCFDKSVEEAADGLPLLLFHDDESFPIGLSESWESKKDGLHGVWRLDDDDRAQRAAKLAEDGLMKWMSVGHTPIRSEWEYVAPEDWAPERGPEFMDKVTRIESRLVETSLVTTPAFAQAQVKLVRSADAMRRRQERRPALRAWQEWRAGLEV